MSKTGTYLKHLSNLEERDLNAEIPVGFIEVILGEMKSDDDITEEMFNVIESIFYGIIMSWRLYQDSAEEDMEVELYESGLTN